MAGVLLQRFIRKNIKICGDISGRISNFAEIYQNEVDIFPQERDILLFTAVFEGQTRSSQLFFRDFPLNRQYSKITKSAYSNSKHMAVNHRRCFGRV